jgi:hypothetical protein
MSELNLKITSVSYHRNGISGAPFYAILFTEKKEGNMVASLFDDTRCAVYKVSELVKGNIEFAKGNSWRGDCFASALMPLLKKHI